MRKTKGESNRAYKAIAELDESGATKFHRLVLLTSGIGFFTDAYDLFIIGVVLSLIEEQWHPSTVEFSLVGSTALIASAIGAVLFGRLADLWGRKRIYGLELILLAGGALASAFSTNIWWLIALRFVVGLGVGGDYPVSATIMSEYAGKSNRGRLVSMVFSMQAIGLIVGPLVAVGLLSTGLTHDMSWRLMLGLGAIPALLVFKLRRQIYETPRFALASGDASYAIRAAKQASSGHIKKIGNKDFKVQRPSKGQFKSLFTDPRLLRNVIGTGGAWLLVDFAFYGNTISSPIVLKLLNPHADLIRTTIETLVIFVVAATPGYALSIWRLDSQGRKSVQAIGFAVMALCFLVIGLVPGLTSNVIYFLPVYGLSYFFMQYGPNTTTFIYPTEVFPVRLRATGHGLAAAAGKLGAFIGTFLFPIMLLGIGLEKTELIVAGVCITGVAVTKAFLTETKQESLEDISGALMEARPLIVE